MLTEDKTHEFKREYTDGIKKSVVAFANTDGGEILVGVDDNGAVRGVRQPDAVILQVGNAIREAIRPDVTMFTDCSIRKIAGKPVVVVTVQRGTARPYYLAGKGIRPEGVFIRHGAASVPASETAILAMIRETAGDSYEAARSLQQKPDLKYTAEYFSRKGVAFGAAQRKTLGLAGSDGMFTNLALLLSAQCPHTMKVGVFGGADKSTFRDRREFSGSLLRQVEEAFAFVDLHNPLRSSYRGLERQDERGYPVEAVREALLNAVVHRDYGLSSASTLVSIFPDRLEVVSVGGLVKGVSLADILLGVSALRNPRLANIFYRLNLIETYGTGIAKIMGGYPGNAPRPEIAASDHAFKVILPNLTVAGQPRAAAAIMSSADARQEKILSLLKARETITRQEAQDAAGVSQASAILLLRLMLAKGVIRKTGGGKSSAYTLA
ncbi:MAG: putative DNA binding domain-containing protein [Opitutaceae bacterium]|jgi:ATP-dependent DNA helicase RecG|nr:putative DNA binding domain-containing protein [Opitutaceae bacterium]